MSDGMKKLALVFGFAVTFAAISGATRELSGWTLFDTVWLMAGMMIIGIGIFAPTAAVE